MRFRNCEVVGVWERTFAKLVKNEGNRYLILESTRIYDLRRPF